LCQSKFFITGIDAKTIPFFIAYITKDERKLTEKDLYVLTKTLKKIFLKKYFHFIITRIVPDQYKIVNIFDYMLLTILSPVAYYIAGRVLLAGTIEKKSD